MRIAGGFDGALAAGTDSGDSGLLVGDDFLYVVNIGTDQISVIDLSDNSIVDTIVTGDAPNGLVINRLR